MIRSFFQPVDDTWTFASARCGCLLVKSTGFFHAPMHLVWNNSQKFIGPPKFRHLEDRKEKKEDIDEKKTKYLARIPPQPSR